MQGGGTVIQLVKHSLEYAEARDVPLPMKLVVVEDARPDARFRQKTSFYRRLAAHKHPLVQTTVFPTPLIACDRDNLLDTVVFTGSGHGTNRPVNEFTVTRNTKAETVFRKLGSMIRYPDIAHDNSFRRELIDEQKLDSMQAANRVEDWLGSVVLDKLGLL